MGFYKYKWQNETAKIKLPILFIYQMLVYTFFVSMMNKVCLASDKFPDLWKAQANETAKSLRMTRVMRMKLQSVWRINERDDDAVPATVPVSQSSSLTRSQVAENIIEMLVILVIFSAILFSREIMHRNQQNNSFEIPE